MERKIGENIRQIRQSLGLTQKQFGEKIGVSPNCVCKWENKNYEPEFQVLRKMKEVFGISYEEIIDGI